jgi:chromosome segregation ATPase
MKKYIFLLLTGLAITLLVQSQTPETLTNSSVVKMSKAKLSDELIVEMIQTSPSRFDLSNGALKNLEGESVSTSVIEAMKKTGGNRNSTLPGQQNKMEINEPEKKPEKVLELKKEQKPVQNTELVSITKPESRKTGTDSGKTDSSPGTGEEFTIEALNYITPLTDLVKFNENEFNSFEQNINEWDIKVRNLKSEVSKSREQMLQTEKVLMQKINADTKSFNDEIKSTSGTLKESREKYKESKTNLLEEGQDLVKKLEDLKNERLRSISKSYGEASQKVGAAQADPVIGENLAAVDYKLKKVSSETTEEIVYTNEILAWYQNEIIVLKGIIKDWNPRVEKVIAEDSRLRKQLEPVENKLNELKPNAKQNKADITALKKEISRIEKERKKLADQMKDDRKELSSYLKQLSDKNQDSVGERFTDIIENINYSFQEKLSL